MINVSYHTGAAGKGLRALEVKGDVMTLASVAGGRESEIDGAGSQDC